MQATAASSMDPVPQVRSAVNLDSFSMAILIVGLNGQSQLPAMPDGKRQRAQQAVHSG